MGDPRTQHGPRCASPFGWSSTSADVSETQRRCLSLVARSRRQAPHAVSSTWSQDDEGAAAISGRVIRTSLLQAVDSATTSPGCTSRCPPIRRPTGRAHAGAAPLWMPATPRRAADLSASVSTSGTWLGTFRVVRVSLPSTRRDAPESDCVRCNEADPSSLPLSIGRSRWGFDAVCTGFKSWRRSAAGDTLLRRDGRGKRPVIRSVCTRPRNGFGMQCFPPGHVAQGRVPGRRSGAVCWSPANPTATTSVYPDGRHRRVVARAIGDARDVVDAATGRPWAHAGTTGSRSAKRRGPGPTGTDEAAIRSRIWPGPRPWRLPAHLALQVDRIVTERVTWLSWPWQGGETD